MSERARKLIKDELRSALEWMPIDDTKNGSLLAAERVIERLLCEDEERRCAKPLDRCVPITDDARRRQRERLEDRMDRSAPSKMWVYKGSAEGWSVSDFSMNCENETPYLCANLKCGQCQRPWALRLECPNGHMMPTSKHAIAEKQAQLDTYVACMAIKVKP